MNTILLLALLIIALYILYRLPGRGAAGGLRTYRTELVQRGVVRTVDDVQADMLHLWRLRCAGRNASRRAVTRRGEMTAHRWNDASRRLAHIGLESGDNAPSYADGAARIRAYVAERKRLAATPSYVEPV